MNPFLKQVALHYYRQDGLGEKMFIFPNRRSMAFFRKHLCDLVKADGKAMLAPRLTTINDFFCALTGSAASERISLLLELYDVYKELNSQAESLDDFIYWGDVLLSDFGDVDKYKVDARMLFTNIADLKAIKDTFEYADEKQLKAMDRLAKIFENFEHAGDAPVNVKEKFARIWDMLYSLYSKFKERLREKGMAYEGMVYRDLADRLETESVSDLLEGALPGIKSVIFVGLNALNKCEEDVMQKLCNAGLAEFCWDYEGKFINENLKRFPNAFKPEGGIAKPKVHLVSVPSATGQAKLLPELISKVPESERGIDFAVVLADETMLMPVVNSLPRCEDGVNVTMGYPMGASEWYSLMRDIVLLQVHMRFKDGQWFFYHKNVKDILSSTIVQSLLPEEEKTVVSDIVKAAKYYIPPSDLVGASVLSVIFEPVLKEPTKADAAQIDALADYLIRVTETLASLLRDTKNSNTLQLDFAKRYYSAVTRLRGLSLTLKPKTWIHLLEQILAGISVPFEGEPLGGLQVMGPLETRALDFKHIVILNANEGIFPRISSNASFIPAELRAAFSLPTYERQDAVWEYYFYRLISRAENVWLLSDSRADGLKTGEESRYAKQLRYLYPDKYEIDIAVAQAGVPASKEMPDIPKTKEDLEFIENYKFSASSFGKYISCPVQFYYYAIKGLKPENEIKESIDAGLLGEVCHDTLRALFIGEEEMLSDKDFDKRDQEEIAPKELITKAYLQEWLGREADIKRKVLSLMKRKLKSVEIVGEDLVTANVIVRFVTRVIESDIKQIEEHGPLHILGLEEKMAPTEICGHSFYGYIDRLDSFEDGVVRVVDYKTGQDDPKLLGRDKPADGLFKGSSYHKYKPLLQFFVYDRLVEADNRFKGKEVKNAMYAMKGIFTEDVQTTPMNSAVESAIEEGIEAAFDQMSNSEVPFTRTQDITNVCKYCDYKIICGRLIKKQD